MQTPVEPFIQPGVQETKENIWLSTFWACRPLRGEKRAHGGAGGRGNKKTKYLEGEVSQAGRAPAPMSCGHDAPPENIHSEINKQRQ